MMKKTTSTVSIANTPVQRALAKAKRSTLLILFIVGIAAGFVYKTYSTKEPGDATPPAVATQRP